jgi:hypothetical protein
MRPVHSVLRFGVDLDLEFPYPCLQIFENTWFAHIVWLPTLRVFWAAGLAPRQAIRSATEY